MNKYCIYPLLSFPLVAYASNETKDEIHPNVLFILVDDMGYGDLSCTGSRFYETPNIDRLASESMSFQAAYAACPVSSPSRAAIMTGKYPARINLTDYIPGNQAYGPHKNQKLSSLPFKHHLDLSEITIAKAFMEGGYSTFFAGKWHLGESWQYYPTAFGFEVNVGGNSSGHPRGGYFSPYKNPQLSDGPKGEYLTDRLTDETINYIRAVRDKPFFAFLSYYAVHAPLQASQEKIEKYKRKALNANLKTSSLVKDGETCYKLSQDCAEYAAMIEHLDENIGRLLDVLEELKLNENTIVIFTSDNGGVATGNGRNVIATSNYPLRSGKGYLYEGGIRVPLFIRWQNQIVPSYCQEPVIGTDMYPTLLDLCGLPLLPNQHIDGASLKPLLTGGQLDREAIYWHFPHYSGGLGGRPSSAIRMGDYKLIEFFEDFHVELYDVTHDVSEKKDLSKDKPDLKDCLLRKLNLWRRQVGALYPINNSYYLE